MSKRLSIIVFCLSLFSFKSNAQLCDSIANRCAQHITSKFVSDGQQYIALLLNTEEYAEFPITFFGETTYRIAGCSGNTDGNLIFNIYDTNRTILFSNSQNKNAPYWDFKIKSTIDGYVEAKLNPNTTKSSGCAVLLIGFKQK